MSRRPPPKPVPRKPGEGRYGETVSERVCVESCMSQLCIAIFCCVSTGHVQVVKAVYPYAAQNVSISLTHTTIQYIAVSL